MAPKFKYFPGGKKAAGKSSSNVSKREKTRTPNVSNQSDKEVVIDLTKKISSLLQDEESCKKAAELISLMINNPPQK